MQTTTIQYILYAAIGVIFLLLLATLVTDLLWPIPLLTREDSEIEPDCGVVEEITNVCPGVTRVLLTRHVQVDLEPGDSIFKITDARIGTYVYFRGQQPLPQIGDSIEVNTIGRTYYLSGQRCHWVIDWRMFVGRMPTAGRVGLIHEVFQN